MKEEILSDRELVQIERAHPDGLTSSQIIQIFQKRGVRLSEATFRKYVQQGLLPRCKRVGSKGKHKGSHGIYPCATVRRINAIKRMMQHSYTIEQIQRNFSDFKQQIDKIEAALDELFKGFAREAAPPRFDVAQSNSLGREIEQARKNASELIRQMHHIESTLAWSENEMSVAGGGGLTRLSTRNR